MMKMMIINMIPIIYMNSAAPHSVALLLFIHPLPLIGYIFMWLLLKRGKSQTRHYCGMLQPEARGTP
jgi:hypothetical protein